MLKFLIVVELTITAINFEVILLSSSGVNSTEHIWSHLRKSLTKYNISNVNTFRNHLQQK